MDRATANRKSPVAFAALLVASVLLSGCEEGTGMPFMQPKATSASGEASQSTRLVERDVEAPEVFEVTEAGLWDGRPSLGGVWVAHPDAKDPERVIIRNTTNNKFVIGALFRREREIPGPRTQV
ncbi:SPOR domain-containing protein, partial [Cribrihabitans sp. XS_ASV171]